MNEDQKLTAKQQLEELVEQERQAELNALVSEIKTYVGDKFLVVKSGNAVFLWNSDMSECFECIVDIHQWMRMVRFHEIMSTPSDQELEAQAKLLLKVSQAEMLLSANEDDCIF